MSQCHQFPDDFNKDGQFFCCASDFSQNLSFFQNWSTHFTTTCGLGAPNNPPITFGNCRVMESAGSAGFKNGLRCAPQRVRLRDRRMPLANPAREPDRVSSIAWAIHRIPGRR